MPSIKKFTAVLVLILSLMIFNPLPAAAADSIRSAESLSGASRSPATRSVPINKIETTDAGNHAELITRTTFENSIDQRANAPEWQVIPITRFTACLDHAGNLLINETGEGTNDDLKLSFDGTWLQISITQGIFDLCSIPGSTGNGTQNITIPISEITGPQVIIHAGNGDDTLTIDLGENINPIPREIVFNGEGQHSADTLSITSTAVLESPVLGFINEHDGFIDLHGYSRIWYTGLEPVTITGVIENLTLNFEEDSETITITGDATETTVDSTHAEMVTFTNPTTSLTINALGGDDNIHVNSLGINYPASITINGDGGFDAVRINPDLTFSGGASLTINAESINLNGSITSGAGQTHNGPVILGSDITLTNTSSGSISLNNTIDGSYHLALINHRGSVDLSDSVGATTPPKTITISGTSITLPGGITTTGGQYYQGAAALVSDCSLVSSFGEIILIYTIDGPHDLAINAPFGPVTFNGQVGGTTPLTKLDVSSAPAIYVNENVTISPAGAITFTTNSIDISGSLTGSGDLAIVPASPATSIGLGGGAGTLILTDTELAKLSDGFNSISIGLPGLGTGDVELSSATFTDPVTIAGGSIHDLGGIDLSAPSATLDGDIAPGQSPGILYVNGDFTFADNSSFNVEIGGTSPGNLPTNHDQLAVTGTVAIGNNVQLITSSFGGYLPLVGDTIIIIDNDGSDPIAGTFASLPHGAVLNNFLGSGLSARISYAGGDGNDVALTVGGAIDIQVSIADSIDPVTAGSGSGNLIHTVTVTNLGPSNASSLEIGETITLPAGASIDSITPSGGSTYSPANSPSGTWSIGNLAVSGTETLTVVITVDASTADGVTISNTATVISATETLINTGDDAATENTTVSSPLLDYGDAPDPLVATAGEYPTLQSNNGARHVLTGPSLGNNRDADPDGQPTSDASGDDFSGAPDDEDGVIISNPIYAGTTTNLTVDLQNADPSINLLDAWIDFNADGDWLDAGEQIFSSYDLGTSSGSQTLNFVVPAGSVAGNTFARFRLSTSGGLAPDGQASDGEIEDYQVTIAVDNTQPTVTINQAGTQPDPSNSSPIYFDVVFNEDVTGFTNSDLNISGISGSAVVTVTGTGTGDTYSIAVSGMVDGETVSADIPLNAAFDAGGNGNLPSTSTDNSVLFDTSAIVVVSNGIIGQPDDQVLIDLAVYQTQFDQLEITFNSDAYDPPGSSSQDDVSNPANYLLIQAGTDGIYDTGSCLDYESNGNLVLDDDLQIPTGPVSYDSVSDTAAVTVNNGLGLPFGEYRLLICGTTSITDLAGNPLNSGADTVLTFSIVDTLPETGFAPGESQAINLQAKVRPYTNSDLNLVVPSLNLYLPIVGVPIQDGQWDVSWLDRSAGYLEGSAYPTWPGNTVLTGHVWNAYNRPGPFYNIKDLDYGDRFYVYSYGDTYIYEVRENHLVSPAETQLIFKSEAYDWVTLMTCERYDPAAGEYLSRRIVRAVLIGVE